MMEADKLSSISTVWKELLAFMSDSGRYQNLLEGFLIIFFGLLVVNLLLKLFDIVIKSNKLSAHQILIRKGIKYFFNGVVVIYGLRKFGIDLKVLLGAAGVFTVALGFASQTSASNLISGLFLLAEKPFSVGDHISVYDVDGIVVSIDLFSTRIRTFNNILIRIPNENLMKTQIFNNTYFPIRRIDAKIPISKNEDLKKVEAVLLTVAENSLDCLDEQRPLFMINGISSDHVDIQFSFWVETENFLDGRNRMYMDILAAFKENNIIIPYQHRVILAQGDVGGERIL
ncbi:MAG TPA: mechanosensitive ion channel family protein [Bacteriovoracaceae bacterium]|nr:mechanosensitive ion channel family protein [Bacteriovoracaceae bacterium]